MSKDIACSAEFRIRSSRRMSRTVFGYFGKSLVPLLTEKKANIQRALFWYFPAYLQSYDGLQDESRDTIFRTRPVSVIGKGDWKLLLFLEEWVLGGGRQHLETNNAVELYNLKKDIGERNNLANLRKRKRDELLDQLINWQNQMKVTIPSEPNPMYVKQ